jgi:hypothetical protein
MPSNQVTLEGNGGWGGTRGGVVYLAAEMAQQIPKAAPGTSNTDCIRFLFSDSSPLIASTTYAPNVTLYNQITRLQV